jgi:hypothetical protein
MMRKTSLILLGAVVGVMLSLVTTQPQLLLDGARAEAGADEVYRQLSLFGDVFVNEPGSRMSGSSTRLSRHSPMSPLSSRCVSLT